MKELSHKQELRQQYRKNGKYSTMLRCEDCNIFVGEDYYSSDDTDITGVRIVLCKSCYEKKPNTRGGN